MRPTAFFKTKFSHEVYDDFLRGGQKRYLHHHTGPIILLLVDKVGTTDKDELVKDSIYRFGKKNTHVFDNLGDKLPKKNLYIYNNTVQEKDIEQIITKLKPMHKSWCIFVVDDFEVEHEFEYRLERANISMCMMAHHDHFKE